MARIPSSGWYVEAEAPSGHVFSPEVVGEPTRNPAVNGLPKLKVPVKPDDRWTHPDWRGQPLRVWYDGDRQPVDEIETVERSEGTVTLVGRGGLELTERVEKEVDTREAHLVVEDLINNNTSYAANVDTPQNSVEENVEVQSADSETELRDALRQSIASTDPLEITGGGKIQPLQVAHWSDSDGFGQSDVSDAAASGGSTESLTTTNLSTSVSANYEIPASDVGVAIRIRNPNDPDGDGDYEGQGFDVEIGNEDLLSFADGFALPDPDYRWYQGTGLSSSVSGNVTIDIDTTSTDGGDTYLDAVVLYDDRYSYTYDNSVDGDGWLSGPELYPDAIDIVFDDAETVRSVAAGRAELTIDNTSNQQAIALSNDQGSSYTTTSNTDTFETDFASLGEALRLKVTLSRYGTQSTASPTTGTNGQSLDAYSLKADLDETPLIVQQTYDDSLEAVLSDIAGAADAVWEYRRVGGTESVEYTQSGQRVSSRRPAVATYESSETVAAKFDKVVVKGSSQRVRQEEVTANHGTAVDLQRPNLQTGKEAVYDPSSGTQYDSDSDYDLEASTGKITTLSDGAISDGSTIAIDYSWRPINSASTSSVSNPKTTVQDLPALTTERGCGLVALRLLDSLNEPLQEARVVVPRDQTGWSIVAALDIDELPWDQDLQIREVKTTPGETVLRLGSRESLGEIVSDIQSRLQSVSRRV